MKNLNTLKSFIDDGFKIERNGQIFTLTKEEMADFRCLEEAFYGQRELEFVLDQHNNDGQYDFAKKYLDDADVCFDIRDAFMDCIMSDAGAIEDDSTINFLDGLKKQEK